MVGLEGSDPFLLGFGNFLGAIFVKLREGNLEKPSKAFRDDFLHHYEDYSCDLYIYASQPEVKKLRIYAPQLS